MNRKEKQYQVSSIKSLLTDHELSYVIGYKGVKSDILFRLRYSLKRNGQVKFVKNTLAKIAAREVGYESLLPAFKDVCILVVTNDSTSSLKSALTFTREQQGLITLKSGVWSGKFMNESDLVSLGNTPTVEQSLSTIAYLLEYPIRRVLYMMEELSK